MMAGAVTLRICIDICLGSEEVRDLDESPVLEGRMSWGIIVENTDWVSHRGNLDRGGSDRGGSGHVCRVRTSRFTARFLVLLHRYDTGTYQVGV